MKAADQPERGRGLPYAIEKILVCGGAASSLKEAAKGADLLVVGSRGHGGFTGLLLGSVSTQLTTIPPAPWSSSQPSPNQAATAPARS